MLGASASLLFCQLREVQGRTGRPKEGRQRRRERRDYHILDSVIIPVTVKDICLHILLPSKLNKCTLHFTVKIGKLGAGNCRTLALLRLIKLMLTL